MSASEANGDFVEIWFKLVKSAGDYPKSQDWEELWAKPSARGYLVSSIPFFEDRVSRGDCIHANRSVEGFLQFSEVISRGGHSTFRALVNEEKTSVPDFVSSLKSMGASCETTLENLVACDVPKDAMEQVEPYLVKGAQEERWGLQDGFIFEGAAAN